MRLEELAPILDSMPDAIVVIDSEGVIRHLNRQAESLFGHALVDAVNQPIEILVPEESKVAHPRFRASYFDHPVLRPMGAGLELSGLRSDGATFPAEISLSSLVLEEGQLVCAAVRDITERRQAKERIQGLLDTAPDATIAVDQSGGIRIANNRAEELFGYSRDELLGQPIELLVPESAKGMHPRHRDRYFSDPAPRPMGAGMELAARRKDGTEFPAEISLSALEVEGGVLVSAAVRDVTDRQKAGALFRGLLEAAPDGMVGVDSNGLIVFVNTQAERMFGYSRNDLLGQPVEKLVPDAVRQMHPGHRSRYFSSPVSRPMGVGLQLAARRSDGTEFPAEISLSALEGEQGRIVTAAVRDVTERKRIEAEREQLASHQSERLESLGHLAGGIAHDFNNLLAMILSYGRFVARRVEDDPDLSQDVAEILAAAERAAALTRQLLIFGRREVLRPEVLDLNEVVHSLERLLRRTIGEHIELSTDFGSEVPPVFVDPGQIEQVIVNLALNARDAMPGGGRLSFRTERRYGLRDGRRRETARLVISDTGPGMTAEVRARAFEPFFTTKPKGSGTGLGLSTVFSIVSQAGGTIDLYSEEGLGTTFRITLPGTTEGADPADRAKGPSLPRGAGQVVLVVEDEDGVRDVASRILRDNGYSVIAFAHPVDAWDLCRAGHALPDVLLTDVVMPGMSGKELAVLVTGNRPGTPVVYMSGYSHDVIAHQGVLEPGVVLVEKPFDEDDLLRAVHEALSGVTPAGATTPAEPA